MNPDTAQITKGLWLGLLGIVIFSVTLPMTRLAVGTPDAPQMSGLFIALGRAVVAAGLSAVFLLATRAPLPRREDWWPLAITAGGVVFGFPLFTSIAMRHVEAVHAAVIIGALPLATAAVGALLHRQRPSVGFWLCAAVGSALVVAFAVLRSGSGGLSISPADLLLLAAVLCAAVGYGYGAKLSQRMQAEHVICWALLISLPLTLPLAAFSWPARADQGVRLVGLCLCGGVFDVAGLFCLVPRPGAGRHGAREPGAAGAAVFVDAVCRAAAG
jgi:drug/metabolite transporter (DMT)-like permease